MNSSFFFLTFFNVLFQNELIYLHHIYICNNHTQVVVFSKSTCPFCTRTKRLMSDIEAGAKVIEINELDNGADVQAALLEISGQRTVPNVFIKGKHVGGNDDCQALAKSGELQKMISE